MKFRSKFNRGFTNPGCLHCAISKVLCSFKGKRTHKARDMQLLLQNVQNDIFMILNMFKNNIKFARAARWRNSKISNRGKNITHIWYSYFVNIVTHFYGAIIESFNAVELYFLKTLKVSCSNTTCSWSMRPIFNK